MATEFINGQWRIPNDWNADESNQNKISNYSMDFSGVNGNINLGAGSPFNFNTADSDLPFSFSMWFNRGDSGIPNLSGLFAKNAEGSLQQYRVLYVSSKLRLMIAPGGTGSGESFIQQTNTWVPNNNQWYHLVFTYDGRGGNTSASGLKMYIDKVEQTVTITQSASYTNMITTTAPLVIGSRSNNQNYTSGSFDLFSVFDYELTQAQINTLYGDSAAGYFQVGNPMALTPNPVAFYPLGDQDLIGAGYYGANWLVPNQVTGNGFNSVFNFNGSQLINLNNAEDGVIAGTTSFTISAWIKPTSTGADQALFGSFGGGSNVKCFTLGILDSTPPANPVNDGALNFLIFTTANVQHQAFVSGANGITFGIWQHVSMTYDTNDLKVFINGVQKQSTSVSNVTLNTSEFADVIGRRSTGNNPYYTGQVSNVAFWRNVVQNPVALYNNGATGDLTSLNPTSWYKLNSSDVFDSGTGNWTIKDYGSRGEDGTSDGMTSSSLVNSDLPSSTSGYSPYAIDLDGTSENFVVDNSSTDLNVDYLTVSVWFNPDALQQFKTLIGNRYFNNGFMSWALQLKNDGTIRYLQKTPSVGTAFVSTDTYNADAWNHVAVTYDGTNAKIYLNGGTPVVYAVTGPIQYDSGFISDNLTIGAAPGSGSTASPGPPSQFIDGQLSNLAIWNSGLSAANVATIYNNGIPGDISSLNPLAWWELGSMMGFNGVNTYTALSNTDSNFAAVSTANMDAANVVNGPGYSDGGLGTSSLVIKEQAPYSFNNGLSENMAISNRDDSQASDPYPYIFELDLSGESNPFTWDSPSMNTLNTFPFTVDWGDGTVESIALSDLVSNRLQHVYDTSAYPRPVIQYGRADDVGQVFTTGASGSQPTASRNVVRFIKQIGNIPWKQLRFYQYANATSKVQLTDIPDFSGAGLHAGQTSFASLMYQSSKLNIANISEWDVSTITTASSMFYQANLPSQDFSKWDTSSQRAGQSAPGIANILFLTFTDNNAFNGDVTNWFTTRATQAPQTFSACTVFNQDVSTKYISAANSPTGAAYIAWDTKNITNMASMFVNASAFNKDISNWDTSSVTNFYTTFSNAFAFNQDISTKTVTVGAGTALESTYTAWDVSNVTTFFAMLKNTAFDNTLDNWELNAGLTNMSQTFFNNNAISDNNFSDNWAIFANSVKDDNSGSGGAGSGFPKGVNATTQNNDAQIKVNRSAPTSTGGVPHFATISRALSSLTSDVQITVNEEHEESQQEYTANFLDTATSSYPTELVGVSNSDYTFNWNGSEWEFKEAGTLLETDQGSATLQAGPDEGVWNLTVVKLNAGWNFNNTGTVYS